MPSAWGVMFGTQPLPSASGPPANRALLMSRPEVARAVAFRAVPRPLDEIGTPIELALSRRSGAKVLPSRYSSFHSAEAAADVEGKASSCGIGRCRLGRQRLEEGEEVAHVVKRHALVGRVGEGRIEMLAAAAHAASACALTKPRSGQAPMPFFGSDEMLGTLNVPNGVLSARPPPSRRVVLLAV